MTVRAFKLQSNQVPPTFAQIKERADALNPFQVIPEAVDTWLEPKVAGGCRQLVSFRWKRRALQIMCADILSVSYRAAPSTSLQEANRSRLCRIWRIQYHVKNRAIDCTNVHRTRSYDLCNRLHESLSRFGKLVQLFARNVQRITDLCNRLHRTGSSQSAAPRRSWYRSIAAMLPRRFPRAFFSRKRWRSTLVLCLVSHPACATSAERTRRDTMKDQNNSSYSIGVQLRL